MRPMPSKQDIVTHFSAIARRYDLVNHLLSANIDRSWRRRLVRLSQVRPGQRVLDICTGTCDILLAFHRVCDACDYVGADVTQPMLDIGREKLRRAGAGARTRLILADALALPLEDRAFDVATMGFGLRNLEDPLRGIGEMARVLKPGGRALILEFAPTQPGLSGRLYGWYLNALIPKLGGIITGSTLAYEHLSQSIQGFFEPETLVGAMKNKGFKETRAVPLFGRIAYIYVGIKD